MRRRSSDWVTMNEIYTYFDASLKRPGQGETFFHWYHSWKRYGWEPRLLHPRTWRDHSLRKHIRKSLQRMYPDDPVEQARWMALLALDTIGGDVFFSEYDVINYGLVDNPAWRSNGFIYACQGFGLFGRRGVSECLQLILEGKKIDLVDSLTFCRELVTKADPSPLVHFSRRVCGSFQKHEVIENFGREY
jgi:hypothetical protein